MKRRGKSINALVLSSLLTVLFVSGINLISEEAMAYTPHAPIYIWMDGGFFPANGVTGGTGTPSDPYIIEGWEIDASTGTGIEIYNSNAHFIIRDVYIHSGGTDYDGIYLFNADNGRVENALVTNNNYGIHISRSDVRVVNSNVSLNNDAGIRLSSYDGAVENCEIYSNKGRGILFQFSENSIATGNTISNNNVGIYFFGAKNVTVTDNNIFSNKNYGTMLWASTLVSLTGNSIFSNEWEGIAFQGSSFVDIVDNAIVQNGYNGIDTYGAQWITIVNNSITANDNHGMAIRYADHVEAIGNTVSSNSVDGIYFLFTNTDVIIDNDISLNGGFGMELQSSVYLTILGNRFVRDDMIIVGSALDHFNSHTITDNNSVNDLPLYYHKDCNDLVVDNVPMGELLVVNCTNVEARNLTIADTDVGIEMAYVDSASIDANNVSSNNHYGIYLYSTSNTALTGNHISHNRNGISIRSSTEPTLVGNTVLSNDEYGIYVYSSVGTTLVDNYVEDNQYGIHFGYSTDTDITHNYASGSKYAIRSGYSTFSNITRNIIRENEFGIHMGDSDVANIVYNDVSNNANGTCLNTSTGIHIYSNNFIDNGMQAWDDNETENFWNDSYPSGGNYWSDYAGMDAKSGPSQDQPGSDGIGDQPYPIVGGFRNDTYPLMNPAEHPIQPPSAPQNLQATPGEGEVTLTWEPPTFNDSFPVSNYLIYRGTSSGSESFLVELGDVLTHTDTGLSNGQTYYYQVSAKTVGGEGERSDEANATPATIPGAPVISDTTVADGRITINWTAPADDGGAPITNYRIYRGNSSGQETFLAETGNVSGFEDTGLTNGVTYFYMVAAVNRVGQGPNSTEVNATPENWPPACTIVDPSPGETISGLYTFSGNLSDSDGTVERVEIRFDDGNWIEMAAMDYWRHIVDSTTLKDGEHTVYARAWDGEKYSPEVNTSFTVDNVAEGTSIFPELWFWSLIVVVIVVVVLAVLLVRHRRREGLGEETAPEEPKDEMESVEETD